MATLNSCLVPLSRKILHDPNRACRCTSGVSQVETSRAAGLIQSQYSETEHCTLEFALWEFLAI